MADEKTEEAPAAAEPPANPPEEEKKPKQSKLARFCTFVYNKKTGEFLGRNCDSWTKIGIFYVIFFIFVFAYFFLFLFIMLAFIKNDKPYHGYESGLIGSTPIGLSSAPSPEQTDSSFVLIQPSTVARFSDQMAKYIANHDHEGRNLGPCTKDNDFGYKSGDPCFAIRLNKQIGWKPSPILNFKGKNSKDEIHKYIDSETALDKDTLNWIKTFHDTAKDDQIEKLASSAWVQCHGTTQRDKASRGSIHYYPYPGIPHEKFNFEKRIKQVEHKPAFVMVQFKNPTPNIPISITCKVIAKNVKAAKDTIGGIQFQFMVKK